MASLLQRLEHLYADFLAADPSDISEVYAENVIFRDPVHELHGLPAVQDYFAGMAVNLRECRFVFDQTLTNGDQASLWWTMHYRHPRLAGGKPLTLRGASLLSIDPNLQRVVLHEDIYDLGAMVYEQIPLLGTVVNVVKRRLASAQHQGCAHSDLPARTEGAE
ncbi:nuclear transport factor 2 family protein [Microbulbifer sp.]|uniref:nuclear transport factor 2 family protein n=1 Tax=Microbulbifer sp. TaxID=1908541 RepID=UPI002F958488